MEHFADIVLDNAFRSFEEDELTLVSKDIRACDVQHHVVYFHEVETYVAGEEFEYEYLYKALAKYANEHQYPLAQQAYEGAGAAEKIHAAILKEAANVKTYEGTTVYVCPICGYVMAGDSIPERCPVCGGPERQYEKF